MNPEEFRKIGHQLIDWIADYRTHVADLPVRSPRGTGRGARANPCHAASATRIL